MKRVVLTTLLVATVLLTGTAIAIFYARGYRLSPENGKTFVAGTGLLVATSTPDGAKVLVNGKLLTATNNTINLPPGSYNVKIAKDGYFPWKKEIIVEKEIVSRADATLFPTAPRLESLTSTGSDHPVMDMSGTLIAYAVASASAEKNGIYILNMNSRNILNIGRLVRQVADERTDSFAFASLEFSPDGSELIASISAGQRVRTYLLSTSGFNQGTRLISPATQDETLSEWQQEKEQKYNAFLESLDPPLSLLAKTYFANPLLSPEKNKVLYTASQSATLPIIIQPRLIGANSTPEQRSIEAKNIYVYDLKEDKNYLLFEKERASSTLLWHPDSSHLLFIQDRKIKVVEYDGKNMTTLYSGPFVDEFLFPWPDGSNLILVTNLNNPEVPPNLYRMSLR